MSKPKGAGTMKWLAQVTLLMIALGAITLAGAAAQDNSAPPSPAAPPQTERERKEQERQRKKEEKEAAKRQQQVGVRCARVRKKN